MFRIASGTKTSYVSSSGIENPSLSLESLTAGFLMKRVYLKFKWTNIVWEGAPVVSAIEPEQASAFMQDFDFSWGPKDNSGYKISGPRLARRYMARYADVENYQLLSSMSEYTQTFTIDLVPNVEDSRDMRPTSVSLKSKTMQMKTSLTDFVGSIVSADVQPELWIDADDLEVIAPGISPKPIIYQVRQYSQTNNAEHLDIVDMTPSLVVLESRTQFSHFDWKAGGVSVAEDVTPYEVDLKQREHRQKLRYDESRMVAGDPLLQSIETLSGGTESTIDVTSLDVRTWKAAKGRKWHIKFDKDFEGPLAFTVDKYTTDLAKYTKAQ